MPMLCRTCGQGAEYSRDLFDQESTDILGNILKLTGILLTNENGVPTRICVSCLLDLKEAIAFRERCITTNNLWFEEQNDLEELDAANMEAELEIPQDINEEDGITSDTTDEVIYPLGTQDAIPAEEDLDPLMSKETIKVENESLHSDAEPCGNDTQELEETPPPPATRKKRGRPPKMHKKKDTPEMKAARSKRRRIRAMAKGLYFCDQCGKSFNDSSNFNTHLTRHTGVKKFECEECGRKEFTQHLLNLHVRIKHRGELPYVCKYCGQRFGNCNYRLKHERDHNPGPRKYKCPICDKGFKDSKTLKDHGLVHSGEHPFHCKLCQTHFGKKTSLKTHLRSIGHRKRAEEQQKNPEDEDLYTMPKPSSTRGPGNHSVYHTKIV
ncbi:transcription factor Ouib-like [Drosophila kikkawai]|uniref:Transcription factor Ouib-like n=1 Tax=Drosophila kikkawai TaxID=30033 RepID=A0A6P4I2B3_DROKI|nr:transcription factor Ouib-like [Drosophila kikkawai]